MVCLIIKHAVIQGMEKGSPFVILVIRNDSVKQRML